MIFFESKSVIPPELAVTVKNFLLNKPPLKEYQQDQPEFYKKIREEENFDASWFPGDNESYTANWLSYDDCKNYDCIKSAVFDYIIPKFEEVTGHRHESYEDHTNNLTLSLTIMPPGGHYRLHKDDRSVGYGFIWYLNETWKWDWGGLLLTVNQDGTAHVQKPEFNSLLFVEHKKKDNNWHCVTKVESHVKEPRISIIGFIK